MNGETPLKKKVDDDWMNLLSVSFKMDQNFFLPADLVGIKVFFPPK